MIVRLRTILFPILVAGIFFFSCQSQSIKEDREQPPAKYKSIYIHNFSNDSYSGELTGELKNMLTQKMSMQQRFQLQPEKPIADLWLYGKIEYYQLNPRDADQFGKITRYNMTVIISVWVRPNPKLSSEDIFDKQYVRFDTTYMPNQPPFESEFTARQRLVDGLCDRIATVILRGWYTDIKSSEPGKNPVAEKKVPTN